MSTATILKLPQFDQVQRQFKFTMLRIASLAPKAKTYYVSDTAQPGLSLRVASGGTKSFVYYRKVNGKPERITLGRLGALSIPDARKACAKYEGQRAQGINPAAERRAAKARGINVDELFNGWFRAAEVKGLRSLPKERRLYEIHIAEQLGRKQAGTLTSQDIENFIYRKGHTHPRTANKIHALLRRLFNHGIQKSLIDKNPCKGVTRYKEVVRDRVLSKDEVSRFFSAVHAEDEPWKSYFLLLIYTGARRSTVAAMRWSHLDLETGTWAVPEEQSKNKKPMTLALIPAAVSVLREQDRLDPAWVFPSATSKSGHIETPTKAWNRIKNHSGISDIRIHDLRRTVGTKLAVSGASAHTIAKVLGHKSIASAQAYVHLDIQVARAALEGAISEWDEK